MLNGYKAGKNAVCIESKLGFINKHFPRGIFPKGAIHEFLCPRPEDLAATVGFVSTLVATNFPKQALVLCIGTQHNLYPPALTQYNICPLQVIFVRAQGKKNSFWAIEEALKCQGLPIVIAEVEGLGFVESRRFQLAVETSNVTCFLLNTDARKPSTTACLSRWQVSCSHSQSGQGQPGVGNACWQIGLQKIRNGSLGHWQVQWDGDNLVLVADAAHGSAPHQKRPGRVLSYA